jgi:hypothetical protein
VVSDAGSTVKRLPLVAASGPGPRRWTIKGSKKLGFFWKKYKLRFSKTGVYLGRTAI